MKHPLHLLFLLALGCFLPLSAVAQHTISGTVTDAQTGETLIGATIYDTVSRKGTTTNQHGRYSLTIKDEHAVVRVSFVGYEKQYIALTLKANQRLDVKLKNAYTLREVVIRGERTQHLESSQPSVVEVPVEQVKAIPMLFGETDVVKAVQLLPGVQNGSEGTAGMYVRGGGPDENLFLLDGIPIYNVNHMGGFFSAFNADAVKAVTLYKGSFPARFGGRLSSVLDVTTNNGNNNELGGNVSVGFVSAKLCLEGPVNFRWKDSTRRESNTTFSLSGRRTYADFFLRPLVKRLATEADGKTKLIAGYYFYDVNAKVTHTFNERSRLHATFYMGNDDAYARVRTESSLAEDTYLEFSNDWGNIVGGLRWNYVINPQLFLNVSASLSRYKNHMKAGMEKIAILDNGQEQVSTMMMDNSSGIRDITLRSDFSFIPNPDHDIQFGIYATHHLFRPNSDTISINYLDQIQMRDNFQFDTSLSQPAIPAWETVLYAEDDWTINEVFKVNYGLHFSTFFVQGTAYPSLQPRLSGRALLGDNLSVKAGYAYMTQYMHLLSTTGVSLPTDLWVPATAKIAPMNAHQGALGVCYTIPAVGDFSVEGYYKGMHNLIEYKDGISPFDTRENWEDIVCIGDGWTYGVEFLLQRDFGNFTGWMGYTWSRTTHLFNRPGQELNGGKAFPAKYDRRHDISIVLSYKFSERLDVSATWVFSSGNAATLAQQQYVVASDNPDDYDNPGRVTNTIQYVSSRNNFRMPDYHRADISVNLHRTFARRNMRRTLNFSVYNLYNRANPYITYVSSQYSYQGYPNALVQLSIFPILPSVAYTLYF